MELREAEKEEKDEKHTVIVSVNEQPVTLTGHTATGRDIKAAAIAQGVQIQPKELSSGAMAVNRRFGRKCTSSLSPTMRLVPFGSSSCKTKL
jgi:hypothetical protein